jgi:GNAT superfamily N-acetyltransferase
MERVRSDGFLISDDRDRIDVDRVVRWLSVESYWATGRSRELVVASIQGSITLGCFAPNGVQVGITRLVTDGATIGVLTDVFVDAPFRGLGLGQFLVETATRLPEAKRLTRTLLATTDAHGLYARFGFSALSSPERWMEKNLMHNDSEAAN